MTKDKDVEKKVYKTSQTRRSKGKGKDLQKRIVGWIAKHMGLTEGNTEDIKSTTMGDMGPDVQLLTRKAQAKVFFSSECANREQFDWSKMLQSYNNAISKEYNLKPRVRVLFAKRRGFRPVAILDAETFIVLCAQCVDPDEFIDDFGGYISDYVFDPVVRPGRKKKDD